MSGKAAIEESTEAVQGELAFRDRQLKRLREEILDIEDADDGVAMNDLTLDDFVADLLQYIQQNRAALEAAPFGIHAIADTVPVAEGLLAPSREPIGPGVVFCLRQRGDASERTPNRLCPTLSSMFVTMGPCATPSDKRDSALHCSGRSPSGGRTQRWRWRTHSTGDGQRPADGKVRRNPHSRLADIASTFRSASCASLAGIGGEAHR